MSVDRTIVGYMDKIDFDHHLEDDPKGAKVYKSIEDLRKHAKHDIDECGIVMVEVTCKKIIVEGDY